MSNERIRRHNRAICLKWTEWLSDHGRAPITVYQYAARCDELLEHLGDTKLEDVTLAQLEGWIARPRKGKGQGRLGSDSTRAKEVLICRNLWAWATKHGCLLTNPTVDLELPRVRNDDPVAIPAEVWHSFWVCPLLTDVERVVFGLGFFCGLRRFEVCQLQVNHLDLQQGRISGFRRKGDRGRKTGDMPVVNLARLFAQEHPRLLPAAESFLDPLEKLCVDRADAQWLIPWGEDVSPARPRTSGTPWTPEPGMTAPDQVNGRLLQALKRAGLPPRAFTPHALRHSFVTYLLRAGVPLQVVSKLANHRTADVTLRYVRVADDPIAGLLTDEPLRDTWRRPTTQPPSTPSSDDGQAEQQAEGTERSE